MRYTTEELESRLRFIVGLVLAMTLGGTVATILFSLVFVQQPMSGIAPADKAFFRILEPIATFLVGALSGMVLSNHNKTESQEAPKAKPVEATEEEPKP